MADLVLHGVLCTYFDSGIPCYDQGNRIGTSV